MVLDRAAHHARRHRDYVPRPPAMAAAAVVEKRALRAKYAEERAKRLRPDGPDQYIRMQNTPLSFMLDDPYMPVKPRDKKTDHVEFCFIGGGFAGLVTGARCTIAFLSFVRMR